MEKLTGRDYYIAQKSDILAMFDEHARAWKPFIVAQYGEDFAETILKEARSEQEALISEIPYIGGDENNMTRHLIRSTTSLAFYKAMKKRGKTAVEAGNIIYDAVVMVVSDPGAPIRNRPKLSREETIKRGKERARKSQERCYPGDWVYEFIEGDGVEFDYGYDFLECGTQKLYRAHDADEFLPFYCFLDFPMSKAAGSGLARTMTLAEGHEKCNFRYKRGRETYPEWPPPFLEKNDAFQRKRGFDYGH